MTARANAAARLVERLRWLDDQRASAAWASVAVDQAFGLIDSAGPYVVLEALLASAALSQQDVAAVIGRDELMALVRRYALACVDQTRGKATNQQCVDAYRQIDDAVERLCQTTPAYELGGGPTS